MGMVDTSDLLMLNGKAILFCGMRMCSALYFLWRNFILLPE